MQDLKTKENDLKNRAYILIEKTKKNYTKYLEERKFLLSLEYLNLDSEETYIDLSNKILEIEDSVFKD